MTAPSTAPEADAASTEDESSGSGVGSWVVLGALVAVVVGTTIALFQPLVPEAVGLLAVAQMLALVFLRMPIALAMVVPSFLGMYALRGFPLVESQFATIPFLSVASWTLSVIPMFILMGLLLWRAGLTESIYLAGRRWLGWMPGGLAVGTNVAGTGLAAVSGSSIGTTYALARIGIPEMLKAGYDKRLAIGSVIVAGLPGQLIPPSILLVIYAGIAEVPIGPQLLAGVGPGLLVSVMFTIMIVLFARRWAPGEDTVDDSTETVTWRDRWASLARIWPIPLLIVVVVAGMFSGVFTATEAGAVAALISIIVTFVWKRGGGVWGAVGAAVTGAVSSVGAIFFILVGVEALSRMFTLTNISTGFAELIQGMDLGRVQFLLLMMIVYIVLGMFMEPLPMMVLTIPILIPTLEILDISLLWYGVFAVFMGELAIVTPPVGVLGFVIHSITKEPEVNRGERITLGDVFGAVWWYMPMAILVVLILIFVPEFATWIPEMGGGG